MSPHAPSLRESLPPEGADPTRGGPAPDRMTALQPQTLPQWLVHNATTRPHEVAQRHKREGVWKEFDWLSVHNEVRAIALGLRARGVQRGQTVLLIGENRPELYWAEWAAMAVGAKAVALYPDATEAEIDYVVDDSQTVCVFAEDQEQVDKVLPVALRHSGLHTVVYWEVGGLWSYKTAGLLAWDALKTSAHPVGPADDAWFAQVVAQGTGSDIALLTYTSGTTGAPKGVIATHASLQHNASLLSQTLQVPEHCEYLSYIPLSWATEQWVGVTLGLMRPMRVSFAEAPDQIQEAIRELACDMVFFGPRQWESLAARVHAGMLDASPWRQKVVDWGLRIGRLVRADQLEARTSTWWARALLPLGDALVLRPLRDQLGLKRARIAMTGGAAVAPDIFRLFAAMGVMLRNVYGCSEVGLLTVHQGARVNAETIGEPVAMGSAWGEPLQWRLAEGGALEVRGGSGFAGYWGKPDKSAEKLNDGWFQTGDAVGQVANGTELIYYDRVEHMSRLQGGHLFSKQFLEIRLRFSPYIREVMVVGDPGRATVTALINIDGDVFGRWAERNGVSFTTFTDLSQRPEVLAQVAAEIARVNHALPEQVRLSSFVNLPKELDADEGELTRTRKLKRDFIAQRYGVLIDAMYEGLPKATIEIPVRYQDGRSGVLRADVTPTQVQAMPETETTTP
ncbi:long-chain fatty acid--CoA ligase [Hydrogenophaga sp.]|uniref:AMP-dependent synthetase/ligase n=1 Tax=Hydrogenophaga sp. TaxID=1904254 RepID=UPI00272F5084|nr:AMP-binding protein [Hydrogenophaga sp.]MDP1685222.1 AMP-binding protein [Hydrogenophaga sp.]